MAEWTVRRSGPAGWGSPSEQTNRWLLRARDAIDRDFAKPLDIPALARIALLSEAHFIRSFRAVFGETPIVTCNGAASSEQWRLLRHTDRTVTDISLAVGFHSLGTFSRTFQAIVGESSYGLSSPVRTAAGVGSQLFRPDLDSTRAVLDKPEAP